MQTVNISGREEVGNVQVVTDFTPLNGRRGSLLRRLRSKLAVTKEVGVQT